MLIAFCVTFGTSFLIFKKSKKQKDEKKPKKWSMEKTLSLILATVFAVRYMWSKDFVQTIFADGSFHYVFMVFLVWIGLAGNLILMLYGFFDLKRLKKYAKFISLPSALLNAIFLWIGLEALLGANGADSLSAKGILFAIEVGIALGYSLFVLLSTTNFKQLFAKKQKQPKPKSWKKYSGQKSFFRATWFYVKQICSLIGKFFKNNWFEIFAVLVIFLATMPPYIFQGLFGFSHQTYNAKNFTLTHRMILYLAFVLPVVVHYSLRHQNFFERKFLLLFICLGTLISFSVSRRFEIFLDPTTLPLHLCNTAMYIMPIVLIFNMKRFFYFTYFINVLGAFFAMLMPDYGDAYNLFDSGLVMFYINHFIAFFMPILFVSLNMFEKPKLKQFIFSMLGFLGYFVFVLILNAVFTGMFHAGLVSQATDYFFINSDFIADKLGSWAEHLRDVTASISIGGITLTFYPIYQLLFFVVYVLLGLGMWFLYEQAYAIADNWADMKKREKILRQDELALTEKLNGRSKKEPMTPENNNKLVLENMSKRYGSSKVFAVHDANLEVHGGEIFGFLGPNGAGKSTIIKSIVGIQPHTSGKIEVCGYDTKTQGVEAKRQIGFVPDHYALYEKLTGREYINYIADLYGVSKEERTKIMDDLTKKFELVGAFDNQIKTYSHGMKQKIAIMAALVHNPKVWILDEPLTGLDPNSIFQVKEAMKKHAKKGNIVFFSSHIIDVVERICDRIAIIKKGNILVTKTVQEIEQSGQSLEDFYMQTIESTKDKELEKLSHEKEPSQEEQKKLGFFAKLKQERAKQKLEKQKKKEQKKLEKEQKKKQKQEIQEDNTSVLGLKKLDDSQIPEKENLAQQNETEKLTKENNSPTESNQKTAQKSQTKPYKKHKKKGKKGHK